MYVCVPDSGTTTYIYLRNLVPDSVILPFHFVHLMVHYTIMKRRLPSNFNKTKTTLPTEKKPRDDALATSLYAALQANRKLQQQFQRRWKELQTRKRRLQEVAVECLHYPPWTNPSQDNDDDDILPCHTTPMHVISFYRAATMAKLRQQQQQQNSENENQATENNSVVDTTTTTMVVEDLSRPKAKQFKYQQGRKWTME